MNCGKLGRAECVKAARGALRGPALAPASAFRRGPVGAPALAAQTAADQPGSLRSVAGAGGGIEPRPGNHSPGFGAY